MRCQLKTPTERPTFFYPLLVGIQISAERTLSEDCIVKIKPIYLKISNIKIKSALSKILYSFINKMSITNINVGTYMYNI